MRPAVRQAIVHGAAVHRQPYLNVGGTAGMLWTLLQPKRGKFQDPDGRYAGRVCSLSIDDWEGHILGKRTVAISAVRNRRAKWCAIDDDFGYPTHLQIYRDVLARLGLEKAYFATPGSDTSRMKIIVVFDQPIPQHQAVALVTMIATLVRQDRRFIRCASTALTLFPNSGDGGVVRILGRHRTRGEVVEMPIDLDGQLMRFDRVEPASIALIETIVPLEPRVDKRPGTPPNLQRWLDRPWPADLGHEAILRRRVAIGRDLLRQHGPHLGFDLFVEAMEKINKHSPALGKQPRGSRPLGRLTDHSRLERLWKYVVARPSGWARRVPAVGTPVVRLTCEAGDDAGQTYHGSSLRPTAQKRAWQVYDAIADLAVDRGTHPHCSAFDLATIADRLAVADTKSVWDYIGYAERLGLLVRLDPGSRDRKRVKGQCAIYCLCGNSESIEDAVADGKTRPLYKERINPPTPTAKPEQVRPASLGGGTSAVDGRSTPMLGLANTDGLSAREIAYAENYRQGGHQRPSRSHPPRLARKVAT